MFQKMTVLMLFCGFLAHAQTDPASANKLNESQVVKALMTLNEGEIDAGKLAKRKAQTKEAKDFAEMMVKAHQENLRETKKVAKKASAKPEKSELSKSLADEAKEMNKQLKANDKAAFDKAYLDQQMTMHKKALSTIDDLLLPAVGQPDLKAHLQKTREAVQKHMAHLESIQTKK